jgi:hypothetical protein
MHRLFLDSTSIFRGNHRCFTPVGAVVSGADQLLEYCCDELCLLHKLTAENVEVFSFRFEDFALMTTSANED